MMKTFLLAGVLACIVACGSKEVPKAEEKKPAAAAADEASKTSVTLDAALQKEAGIAVEAVAARALPQSIRAAARVSQDENFTWRVGSVTEGRVESIAANVGDVVQANQVIARVHAHDIHESRAEYQKALANLQSANAAEAYARKVRDRARRLYELKAGALADADHAESQVRDAQTAVTNAKTEVERTRFHLEDYLGVPVVEKHKGGDEDLVPVRAPRGGVVITRNISIGSVVNSASDLFFISDLSHVWAIAEVQEDVMPRLRVDMPARLFVNAYGDQPFASRIARIGDSLDAATRMVKVRLELANPGMRLRPEMFGTAEIEIGSAESAMMLPAEAVQDVRGASIVFVRTAPTKFELRPVETGRSRDGAIEIRKGLKAGDEVAVKGVFILKSEFLKASLAEE